MQDDPAPRPRRGARRGSGREMVLDAAVHQFEKLGYHGTSMREIAKAADITAGSIYHHFDSKQQILREIMERVLGDSLTDVRRALDAAPTEPGTRLGAVMRAWVLFHTQRRAEAMIGASEIRSLDTDSRRTVVGMRDEIEEIFRDVVREGVDAGVFSTAHPREATWAIITMGTTVATFYRPDGTLSPEEISNNYVDLALGVVGWTEGQA